MGVEGGGADLGGAKGGGVEGPAGDVGVLAIGFLMGRLKKDDNPPSARLNWILLDDILIDAS